MNNNHRINIKILPDKTTITNINKLLKQHGISGVDFHKDSHCTIIYSPDIIDVNKIILPETELPFCGINARFEFFDTRDDGIVLVIEFDCLVAQKLFKYLKDKYKFTTKYNDFRPHITIQKNIANKTTLPKIDFDLYFDNLIKEII